MSNNLIIAYVCLVLLALASAADGGIVTTVNQESDLIRNYKITQPLFTKAMNLFANGDFQGTIEQLRNVLALMPGHAEASLYLGICSYQEGEYEEALGALEEAISSYHRWHKQNYEIRVAQFDESQDELRDLEQAKMEWDQLYQAGGCTGDMGRSVKEIDTRIRVLREIKPPTKEEAVIPANYYFHRANCLMRLGRYEEAYSEYMKAIEADQGYADAYTNLAGTLVHRRGVPGFLAGSASHQRDWRDGGFRVRESSCSRTLRQ